MLCYLEEMFFLNTFQSLSSPLSSSYLWIEHRSVSWNSSSNSIWNNGSNRLFLIFWLQHCSWWNTTCCEIGFVKLLFTLTLFLELLFSVILLLLNWLEEPHYSAIDAVIRKAHEEVWHFSYWTAFCKLILDELLWF